MLFVYFSVVNRPDLGVKEIILRHFVKVWNKFYGKSEDLFKNILCNRNIMIMAQPCNDKLVWTSMARFVAFLIKREFVSCDNFEFQCTAFYQKNWNAVIINYLLFFRIISYLYTFCYEGCPFLTSIDET